MCAKFLVIGHSERGYPSAARLSNETVSGVRIVSFTPRIVGRPIYPIKLLYDHDPSVNAAANWRCCGAAAR